MDIRDLCEHAGIAIQFGSRDSWGHWFEPDEFHFGFVMEQQVFCFRYHTCEGSDGWFVNISPDASKSSLTFVRIGEIEVIQTVMRYLSYRIDEPKSAAPVRERRQQFSLFG